MYQINAIYNVIFYKNNLLKECISKSTYFEYR